MGRHFRSAQLRFCLCLRALTLTMMLLQFSVIREVDHESSLLFVTAGPFCTCTLLQPPGQVSLTVQDVPSCCKLQCVPQHMLRCLRWRHQHQKQWTDKGSSLIPGFSQVRKLACCKIGALFTRTADGDSEFLAVEFKA